MEEIVGRKKRRSQFLEHLYKETYNAGPVGLFKDLGSDLGFTEAETEEAVRDLFEMGLVKRITFQVVEITLAGKTLVEGCMW